MGLSSSYYKSNKLNTQIKQIKYLCIYTKSLQISKYIKIYPKYQNFQSSPNPFFADKPVTTKCEFTWIAHGIEYDLFVQTISAKIADSMSKQTFL